MIRDSPMRWMSGWRESMIFPWCFTTARCGRISTTWLAVRCGNARCWMALVVPFRSRRGGGKGAVVCLQSRECRVDRDARAALLGHDAGRTILGLGAMSRPPIRLTSMVPDGTAGVYLSARARVSPADRVSGSRPAGAHLFEWPRDRPSRGGGQPFSIDVTGKLLEGANVIAVKVIRLPNYRKKAAGDGFDELRYVHTAHPKAPDNWPYAGICGRCP